MDLFSLLNDVKQAIYNNPDTPHQPGRDPGGLIESIEGLFNQHADEGRRVRSASQDAYGDPGEFRNVRPASEDPYGDPGFGGQRVRSASQDPYGDPAERGFRDQRVRPASEDPYGDPADA